MSHSKLTRFEVQYCTVLPKMLFIELRSCDGLSLNKEDKNSLCVSYKSRNQTFNTVSNATELFFERDGLIRYVEFYRTEYSSTEILNGTPFNGHNI